MFVWLISSAAAGGYNLKYAMCDRNEMWKGRHWRLAVTFPQAHECIFLAMLTALTVGCRVSPRVEEAKSAIERFHRRLDSEQYAAIYSDTDDAFRASTSEKEFTDLLSAIHRKLGRTQSVKVDGWTVNASRAAVVCHTKFAEGVATERFRWRFDDKRTWLIYYNINSNALIVK